MTGRFYMFPLRLGKEGRSKIRRVLYGLRDTEMIFFFNEIISQNDSLIGKFFLYWFRFGTALQKR